MSRIIFSEKLFHWEILVLENISCYKYSLTTSMFEILYFLKSCPIFVCPTLCPKAKWNKNIWAGTNFYPLLNEFQFCRAENLLHEYFGDAEYWAARRSMRFAGHLVNIANKFRETTLNSNDVKDVTVKHNKWEIHQPKRGTAKGGPYICAHVRRKDYTFSRKDSIPG